MIHFFDKRQQARQFVELVQTFVYVLLEFTLPNLGKYLESLRDKTLSFIALDYIIKGIPFDFFGREVLLIPRKIIVAN